jgi:hypothetical protein
MKLHVITAFLFGSCAMVASALEFRVVDHANRPIEGARVAAGEASVYTDAKGRAQLKGVAELKVQVEAQGFEGQTRVVERKEAEGMQLFTLGRPGMHYYYRGKVKVPFEPFPGTIGVLAKRKNGATKADTGPVAAAGERIGGRIIRTGKNFARSGVVVFRFDDADDEAIARLLRELEADPSVEAAGAVVRLSEDHASFLTDLVIARFEEGVDDGAAAAIAGRQGLSLEGRFGPLGNVHRLRAAGPATYAVLEAANALAEEPEVVWAEPDLVATSEEDATD